MIRHKTCRINFGGDELGIWMTVKQLSLARAQLLVQAGEWERALGLLSQLEAYDGVHTGKQGYIDLLQLFVVFSRDFRASWQMLIPVRSAWKCQHSNFIGSGSLPGRAEVSFVSPAAGCGQLQCGDGSMRSWSAVGSRPHLIAPSTHA